MGESAKHITDPALVVYHPLESCIMPAQWHQGRVLLIGDAAHDPVALTTRVPDALTGLI